MEILKQIKIPAHLSQWFGKKSTKAAASTPVSRVACDFGKSKIICVEVEKSGDQIRLLKFHRTARTTAQGKDAETLKEFFDQANFSTRKLRISVKGQGVIIRFVQFPQMKLAELRSAISFEIDQYIPFKAPEVIWDCQILEENIPLNSGLGMNVLLVAVKKEELSATLQIFQNAGLEVELIDTDALASINALEFFHPEELKSPVAILDIGSEVSTLSVIFNGKPRFIRDITYGGFDILKRLKRKLGMSEEQAAQQIEVDHVPTPEATAVIKEALGDLVAEIQVSLNYYLDQIPSAEPVKKLFVEGGGGYHPLVLETIQQSLGFPIQMINIVDKLQIGPDVDENLIKKNQGILPVAVGLCLRDQ